VKSSFSKWTLSAFRVRTQLEPSTVAIKLSRYSVKQSAELMPTMDIISKWLASPYIIIDRTGFNKSDLD